MEDKILQSYGDALVIEGKSTKKVMLKYLNTQVTFAEVPDEITLCINITGCKNGCKNCHSSYLAEDIGNPLNKTVLSRLLEDNKGISCVSFMGGDRDTIHIVALASWVKTHTNLKVAWYSGCLLYTSPSPRD